MDKKFDALLYPLRAGEREQVVFETSHIRKDGSSYPVKVQVQFFPVVKIPVFAAIVQDVSERMMKKLQVTNLVDLLSTARICGVVDRFP
jgi:PAS domain S-box-containing protein